MISPMRFKLVLFLLFMVFVQAYSTGLSSDVITIKGQTWSLLSKPIWADSVLYTRLMNFIPKNHCISTANWDGFTAYWIVRRNRLYLQKIEVCVYDKDNKSDSVYSYDVDALKDVFREYYHNDFIRADWFCGQLRAGCGELVRYVHLGFDRNLEEEIVMTVNNGRIVNCKHYNNFKRPGLTFKDVTKDLSMLYPWERFPEITSKRISFICKNFKVTSDGHLVDFEVSSAVCRNPNIDIDDENHPVILEFKKVLRSIYPWEVMYINGKYVMEYNFIVIPLIRDVL